MSAFQPKIDQILKATQVFFVNFVKIGSLTSLLMKTVTALLSNLEYASTDNSSEMEKTMENRKTWGIPKKLSALKVGGRVDRRFLVSCIKKELFGAN